MSLVTPLLSHLRAPFLLHRHLLFSLSLSLPSNLSGNCLLSFLTWQETNQSYFDTDESCPSATHSVLLERKRKRRDRSNEFPQTGLFCRVKAKLEVVETLCLIYFTDWMHADTHSMRMHTLPIVSLTDLYNTKEASILTSVRRTLCQSFSPSGSFNSLWSSHIFIYTSNALP